MSRITTLDQLIEKLDPVIAERARAIALSMRMPTTPTVRGSGGSSGGGGNLNAHAGQSYIDGHDEDDPPNKIYHGKKWGIRGGTGRDESDRIIAALEAIREKGGGTLLITALNHDPVIEISKPISIYGDNIHFQGKHTNRWRGGARGGIRVMGEYDEYSPLESGFALKLRENSYENDDNELVLPLVVGQADEAAANGLVVGAKITIRGRNDINGKAVEKQTTYVKSIVGDDITCVDEADFTFQPTYDDTPWPPDATTGTTIYIVRYGAFVSNQSRGAMAVEMTTVSGFAVGDLVEIGTNETEYDVNNGAISGTPAYPNGRHYLNPARREQAKIVAIDGTTVTFNRALSHDYDTTKYAGISKLLPVKNSKISGIRFEYYEDQVNRSVHPLSIVYGEDCHVFDCTVDGSNGQKGQGCRIAYSYNCSVFGCTFQNPKFVASGDGYGPSLYYSTLCRVHGNTITGCRHSVLLQLATACLIYSNISTDDYISAYDAHGVNSRDCMFIGNYASRSANNSPDSSDCGAFRIGNTSHVVGDWFITVANNLIDGYMHTNSAALEVLASSSHVTFIGNVINGCQIGFKYKRNPSWITPVQTATNIMVIGNRFSKCASRCVEVICDPDFDASNSSGKIEGLLIESNISDGNSIHFDIESRLGLTNLRIVRNEIWNPVAASGVYAIDVDQVLGTVEVAYNICCGANRGIRIKDTENAVVTFNILSGTVEDTPFTMQGTTTGLVNQLNVPFTGGGGGGDLSAEFTAKGQILVGTGSGTWSALSVGTNGFIYTADSAQSTGTKWTDTLPTLNLTTAATNVNGLTVNMVASNTVDAIELQYDSTERIRIITQAAINAISVLDFDNASSNGPFIQIGRNTNSSTPAAGFLALRNRANTLYRLWVDASGNLRIWDGGNPTNANDASGSIVGGGGSITWPQKIADSGSTADPASGTAGALVYYNSVGNYDVNTGADGVFVVQSKSSGGTLRDVRIVGRHVALSNAAGIIARVNSSNELIMEQSSYKFRAGIIKDRGTSGLKLWGGSVDKGIEVRNDGVVEISDLGMIAWGGITADDDIVTTGDIIAQYTSGVFGHVLIDTPNTSALGLEIDMQPSTTAEATRIRYNGTNAFRFFALSNQTLFTLDARNLGNNVAGPSFVVNRNTNAGAEGPAPGSLNLVRANGGSAVLFFDNSAVLRVHSAIPTGSTGSPTVNITAGTAVGDQTSHAAYKRIIGPPVSGAQALANIVAASQQVREFEYLDGRYGHTFSGLVIDGDTLHRYGKDPDEAHPAGRALSEINLFGDLMLAVAELSQQLDDMKARLN